MKNIRRFFRALICSAALAAQMSLSAPASAQTIATNLPIPHDWHLVATFGRSPTHPYNLGQTYEDSYLQASWSWLLPNLSNYPLYTIKDAAGNFTALGRRKWIDVSTLPPNGPHATFCGQQNIPVPGLGGVTVPGVLRQTWEFTPGPLGPQNFRLSVYCSGPLNSTLPWYVFILDNTNPLAASIQAVFKS